MPLRVNEPLKQLESTVLKRFQMGMKALGLGEKLPSTHFRLFSSPTTPTRDKPCRQVVQTEVSMFDQEILYVMEEVKLIEDELAAARPRIAEIITTFVNGEREEPEYDSYNGTMNSNSTLVAYIHLIKSMVQYYQDKDEEILERTPKVNEAHSIAAPEAYQPYINMIHVFRQLMRRHITLNFLASICQENEPAFETSRLADRFNGVASTLPSTKHIDAMIEQDLQDLAQNGEVYCVGGYAAVHFSYGLTGHAAYFKLFRDKHGHYYRVDYNAGDESAMTSLEEFDDAAYSVDARRITVPTGEDITVEEVIRRMLVIAYERNIRYLTLAQHESIKAENEKLLERHCPKSNRSLLYSKRTIAQRKGNCTSRSLREVLRGGLGASEFTLLERFVLDRAESVFKAQLANEAADINLLPALPLEDSLDELSLDDSDNGATINP